MWNASIPEDYASEIVQPVNGLQVRKGRLEIHMRNKINIITKNKGVNN